MIASRGISNLRARGRQVAEPVKNEAADRIDSFGLQLESEMLAQIVETGVPADEKPPIFERFDVEIGVAQRAPRRS